MPRRANPRRVRSHLVYTVAEAADALNVHKGTVRRWIKVDGLPAAADRKPSLIDGCDLKQFLETRNRSDRKKLGPGEFYCLSCRDRRKPDGGLVDYRPRTIDLGMLIGLCPRCGTAMHRACRKANLGHLPEHLEVAFQMAPTGLSGSTLPILNVDLQKEPETHGKTQR